MALRANRDAAAASSSSSLSSAPRRAADYLVGQALDEAERSGEELEILWPLQRLDRAEQSTAQKQQQQQQAPSDVDGKGKAREKSVEGVQDWAALEALLCVAEIDDTAGYELMPTI